MKNPIFFVFLISNLLLNFSDFSLAQSSTLSPSSSPNKDIEKLESKLNRISGDITKLSEMNNHFKFWLLFLGTVGCLEGLALLIIGYLYFNTQRQLTRKVRTEVTQTIDQRTQHLLTHVSNQNTNQGELYKKNKERLLEITEKLSNIENLIYSLEVAQAQVKPSNHEVNPTQSFLMKFPETHQLEVDKTQSPVAKEKEIDIITKHFNDNDKNYFQSLKFQTLKLKKEDIDNGIIKFELTELNQELFLKVEVDSKQFLFPNINSSRIYMVMNRFKKGEDYHGIFEVPQGDTDSTSWQLIKPAKLKEVNHGIWEIEELGEFIN